MKPRSGIIFAAGALLLLIWALFARTDEREMSGVYRDPVPSGVVRQGRLFKKLRSYVSEPPFRCTSVLSKKWPVHHACGSWHPHLSEVAWEIEELEHLMALPPQYTCMVNFGEWLGPISLLWLQHRPNSEVVAFEPDPLAFAQLSSNLEAHGISPFNMCVNKDGGMMYTKIRATSESQVHSGPVEGGIPVRCVAYRDLIRMYPDCIFKIDTEGGEFGIMDDLIKYPPKVLYMSTHGPGVSQIWGPQAVPQFREKLAELKKAYTVTMDYDSQYTDAATWNGVWFGIRN